MSQDRYESLIRLLRIITILLGLVGVLVVFGRYLLTGHAEPAVLGGSIALTGTSQLLAGMLDMRSGGKGGGPGSGL